MSDRHDEETAEQFRVRNAQVCTAFTAGQSIEQLAETFKLSHQRIRQIVRRGGVWKKRQTRPAFLGVDVTDEVKDKLKAEADRRGTSMSKLASETIAEMLNERPE